MICLEQTNSELNALKRRMAKASNSERAEKSKSEQDKSHGLQLLQKSRKDSDIFRLICFISAFTCHQWHQGLELWSKECQPENLIISVFPSGGRGRYKRSLRLPFHTARWTFILIEMLSWYPDNAHLTLFS